MDNTEDPTADVMAAIARIVENPSRLLQPAVMADDTDTEAAQPAADGYSRLGPGPLAALRFQWTARRGDNADYYVDETIGDSSRPISSGPMTAEEAIAFVDTKVKEAREQFDRLKAEMTASKPPPDTAG
jgi:hypothetical protein